MTFYLSGASAYFVFLLFKKFSDSKCSKTDPQSWLVVAIASSFWIVVIPLSVLEVRTKAKKQSQLEDILNSSDCYSNLQPAEVKPRLEFESNPS